MKAFSEEWKIAFAEKINSNNNYAETAYGLVMGLLFFPKRR
jgi:hypothetical protein